MPLGTSPAEESVEALVRIGRLAIEPLIQALKEPNSRVRAGAAQALGRIGDKTALEPLIEVLEAKDTDWYDVRTCAAAALDMIDPQWRKTDIALQAVPRLVEKLKDPAPDVRSAAAKALGMIGDKAAVEPLIKALNVNDHALCWAACDALDSIDPKWSKSDSALRAVPVFIEELKCPDFSHRWRAATGLGEIGDTAAVEPLIQTLVDAELGVRSAAREALDKVNSRWSGTDAARRSVPLLIQALKEPRASEGALQALEMIDPQWNRTEAALRAVPVFIRALKDPWSPTRSAAASALGRIGDKSALEPLKQALKDPNWEVRRASIRALAQIGDKAAVEPLIQALVQAVKEETLLCDEVLQALEKTDPQWNRTEAALRAVPVLIQALKDPYSPTRSAAARVLEKITGQRFAEDASAWTAWWQSRRR